VLSAAIAETSARSFQGLSHAVKHWLDRNRSAGAVHLKDEMN